MSKANDKLSKLASFGTSAGAKPAANAQAVVEELEAAVAELPAAVVVEKIKKPKVKAPAVVMRRPLVRNVIFTHEDQLELERLEDAMRQAGISRPSIADIVRIALRAAQPTAEQAGEIFRQTKLLDGRTYEGKKLRGQPA
jgi:hypothetical protein